MLLYHGGTIFGRLADDPSALAKTMLGVMIFFLNGGPKVLTKLLPVSKLHANFLLAAVNTTSQCMDAAGVVVKAIVCDGNRINQSFFRMCKTVPDKPWLAVDGKYLLFDFVHLLKNIQNLWLTEKTGEIKFFDSGIARIAKWAVLKKLFDLECKNVVKLSDLNEVSIAPKPIERQRVSTCLCVFSEKTHSALITHPSLAAEEVQDTAIFLKKVITWWKIVNVKALGANVRHNDPLQAAISDPHDKRLDYLLEFGDMALEMAGTQGKQIKQFSKDTANAIHHTCNGLVDLCRNILSSSHKYVLLGQFTSDHLEKEFGKLRQGCGGTYFLTVQQILEKLSINQASLLLKLDVEIEEFSVHSGHQCSSCVYKFSEDSEIFDGLADLEIFIPEDVKMSLVYIAGYVTRNDDAISEGELLGHTFLYYEKYGHYTKSLDRGGLKVPTDETCQWAFFCFTMFHAVKNHVCRNSLSKVFGHIAEFYDFNVTKCHCNILSNIFLNKLCIQTTSRSGKEPAVKILKLS